MAPYDNSRRGSVVVIALIAVAFLLFFTGGSFAYCPAVPSFDTCKVVPTCAAVHIDRADGSGPAWRCESRFGR